MYKRTMEGRRNEPCSCGMGFKFKHCCGAMSPVASAKSDEKLALLAVEADDEGLASGEDPKQRAFKNILRILQRLRIEGVPIVGSRAPTIVKRVHAANDRLFRKTDMQEGGIHLGFFMFRDLYARFYVPVVFGSPEIDFLRLLDLSDEQKQWMGTDDDAVQRFEDQALDLFDFGYGFLDFGHSRPVSDKAKDLIYRAHVHLEAAAATATSAYNFRGTVQSALLGAELALKTGLACKGIDEKELRQTFGHDLQKAAIELAGFEPNFDADRVRRAVSEFPHFAQSRYDGPIPSRLETGEILMKAQYVASEVTRTFTDRNLRKSNPTRPRTYPC